MTNQNLTKLFTVQLNITSKHARQALEIRRMTQQPEDIKAILDAAFTEQPVIVYPRFTNKLRAINRLMNSGIIDYDFENKVYKYLI